jgi:hypothetical protein
MRYANGQWQMALVPKVRSRKRCPQGAIAYGAALLFSCRRRFALPRILEFVANEQSRTHSYDA